MNGKFRPLEISIFSSCVNLMILIAVFLSAVLNTHPAAAQQVEKRQHRSPLEGPWNHDLQIMMSRDGEKFFGRHTIMERGGVPCVAREDSGRLILVFQWFPYDNPEAFDKVSVSFSDDEGETWTVPEPVIIENFPHNLMRPFDPTIVILKDGSYRLYYTSRRMNTDSKPEIYSASSVDAVHYSFEKGVRSVDAGGGVVDSSAVYWNGEWHLFAHEFIDPRNGRKNDSEYRERAYHAVSKDGLNFVAADRILLPEKRSWIGNFVKIDDELVFYGSGESTWSAVSIDGYNWEFRDGGRIGGDPAAFRATDGSFRVIFTGPLRDDASPPPFRQ